MAVQPASSGPERPTEGSLHRPGADWILWASVFAGSMGLAGLFLAPLWSRPGLPNTADGLLHVQRAAVLAWSLDQGVLWPRWLPQVYAGLGAPVFHYYSPLFHWLIGLFHWAGVPLDVAVKALVTAGFVAGGLGVGAWLWGLLSIRRPGSLLVGMALYLSAPFLFREYYVQGDYPQLLAWMWTPVCLAGVTALHGNGHPALRLAVPLSLAILVLLHHLTALLVAGLLVLCWLALAALAPQGRGLWRTAMGGLLGLGLAGFYWLPALGDLAWVQIERARSGFFLYSRYWLSGSELLSPVPVMDTRAANPPLPHTPGLPAWLALALGGLLWARPWARGRCPPRQGRELWVGAALGVAGLALALTTAQAAPLWERLSLLQMFQFPWRFLGLVSLAAAPVAAWTLDQLQGRLRSLALVTALLGIGVAAGPFLFPNRPFLPLAQVGLETIKAREQAVGTWGTTGSNEFLPIWADLEAILQPTVRSQALPVRWRSPHRGDTWVPGTEAPSALDLRLLYFPAWQVHRADGRPVAAEPSPVGLLRVRDPGVGSLSIRWAGSRWQHRGAWLSALAGILALAWAGRALGPESGRGKRPAPSPGFVVDSARREALWGLGALVGLMGVRALLARHPLGIFQRHSPPGQVLGVAHPLDVPLALDGVERVSLLGWELLTTPRPRPGSGVRVRLYWQPLGPLDVDLASMVHLYTPATRTSWAVGQNMHPGQIPTRHWHPALYYVDQVEISLPVDTPPATFTLAAGLVTRDDRRLLPPGNPDGLIFLGEIRLEPLRAGWLQAVRPQVPTPADTEVGLHLQGYDLLPAPGGPVLRLYWTPVAPVRQDWTVYVHLYHPRGPRIAQYDGPPLAGLLPTREWEPGRLYVDRRVLPLPEPLEPGVYRFLVGLYRVETGERALFRPRSGAPSNAFQDGGLVIAMAVSGEPRP